MNEQDKSKDEYIAEIEQLCSRINSLEQSELQHVRVEEELMHLNKQMQDLLDNSPVIIIRSDITTKVTYVNKRFEKISGYSSEDILGRSWISLGMINKESIRIFINRMREKLGGKPPEPMEVQIKRKDGQLVWVSGIGEVIKDRGIPVGFQVIAQDITERRQEREKFKLITEHSADIIYMLRIKDERFTYVSPSIERMLGYTEAEALSLHSKDILTTESYGRQRDNFLHDILSGIYSRILELEAIHKDGHIIPVELHAHVISDESGESIIVGVVRDITERKKAEDERKKIEEQLILTDRLASVGELAAGIAHELNNPLTGVVGYSDLLLERNDIPQDILDDLTIINREAIRAGQIARHLLTFARRHPDEKRPIDITKIIELVLDLRAYEQKVNNIGVKRMIAEGLPPVLANDFQLQQVFLNIIINAEYFMIEEHGRGTLTVVTERINDIVRISFTDDGPGISSENLPHIFDPFFTTKDIGKGTGLGLSICYGIITEHGGIIRVKNKPGQGTTFIIELPVWM